MQTRQLLNLVLAIVLAGLIAMLVFEPGETPSSTRVTLTHLKPVTIQRITINKPGHETISLQKHNQQWQLTAPFSASANTARIERLLEVASAASLAQYALSNLDRHQLRLDKPQFQLGLDDVILFFGTTEPISQNRYVQAGDTVHLILDRYSYLLHGTATDFVETRLLPEGAKITALKLPTLELTQQDAQWQLLSSENQASADDLHKLVDSWRFARALNVSRIKGKPAGKKILIRLAGETQAREYLMQQTSDEFIFQHPASGLQYHFTIANATPMLSLAGTYPPANSSATLSTKPSTK